MDTANDRETVGVTGVTGPCRIFVDVIDNLIRLFWFKEHFPSYVSVKGDVLTAQARVMEFLTLGFVAM